MLRVIRTRTADLADPLGLGDAAPYLSWQLAAVRRGARQVAYQVQAATTADRLAAGRADLWDTGRRPAPEQRLRYGGEPLGSRARVHWRVRAWDGAGPAGPWSPPAVFELGLLRRADWTASWITHPRWAVDSDPEDALPLFAADFTVAGPVTSARLYLTGVGIWVATLNGMPVTDAVLEPPNTDFARRVVYTTADVTGLVRPGDNTIGVQLGPGIAHVRRIPGRYTKFVGTRAFPAALVQLELHSPDGTRTGVVSDSGWRTTPGPTLMSHWYGGEHYDARREIPAGTPRATTARGGRRSRWSTAPTSN